MDKDEKRTWVVVRVIAAAIGIIVLYLMFINEPQDSHTDKFVTETMWEAVHPMKWLDWIALAGMVYYFVYLTGLAGKAIYEITGQKAENSSGMSHLIFVLAVLLHLLFYV